MNVNPLDLHAGDKVYHSSSLNSPMQKLTFFCRITESCYRFFTVGSIVQLTPEQISTECYPRS